MKPILSGGVGPHPASPMTNNAALRTTVAKRNGPLRKPLKKGQENMTQHSCFLIDAN
jgi:hypothetical protein